MKIVDLAISTEGRMYVLDETGEVLEQSRDIGLGYQHVEPSQRPEFVWQRFEGPDGVKLRKLFGAVQGDLYGIGADGKLYRRVRDWAALAGERWTWQQVEIADV